MASSKDYLNYVLEQLSSLEGISYRAMMGEYTVRAMYTDDAKADGPLLAIAKEKYIVTHGKVEKQA